MNVRLVVIVLCAFFVLASTPAAEEAIPVRVNRLTDRVAVFAPGKYAPPASIAVISTDQGLILIDTGLSRKLTQAVMAEVGKVMGRSDVLCVINTHHHFDHTSGNPLFPGVDVIGHENAGPAIARAAAGAATNIPRIEARIRQREDRLKTLDADSTDARGLVESNRFDRIVLEETRAGLVPTPPTKTFGDKLTHDAGGLELRLYSFGRAHTDNDIVVHVPALGLLFTGDLFHTDSISVTAAQAPFDVPRWLEVLGEVLKPGSDVRTVVGGHMLVYTREWLDAQHRYISDLWAAVLKAKAAGTTLEQFKTGLPLGDAFGYLEPHFDLNAQPNVARHQANIQDFWRVGMKSASAEIERVVREAGPDAGRARFDALLADGEREFYLDERELNALGYRFMNQERKIDEAVAVLEMNTRAFPRSWNVWDSLGEAFYFKNDRDRAERCYEKSLELNPDNQSGKNALSRIRGTRLDVQGETKLTQTAEAGRSTGLRGPYLGQPLPGLKPEVFAPGLVSTAGNYEFSITFSPDGREAYFTRRGDEGGRNTIMVSRWEKDGWTAPEEAAFCKGFPSNAPHVTPDGKKLFFGCFRAQPGAERAEYGIWFTERTADGWGEPRFYGVGMFVSSDRSGNLYMTDITQAAGGGLVMHPRREGAFGPPVRMPAAVNEPTPVAHGFMAPDGGYVVFDTYFRPGGQGGEGDLYVSFKNPDGSWTEARNLGDEVNTPATNFCPSLSPDGKYLFFSTRRDIYWVSAEVIERLRPVVGGDGVLSWTPESFRTWGADPDFDWERGGFLKES